jgi:hypothetical protein
VENKSWVPRGLKLGSRQSLGREEAVEDGFGVPKGLRRVKPAVRE